VRKTDDEEMSSSETIRVRHLEGDEFTIAVRHHLLRVDQPLKDGGADHAPTPTELFVSSLAACVAFYVRRFLHRHGLATEGLVVDAIHSFATNPARVGSITIAIRLPNAVPDERHPALLAVARHCAVHNTLQQPPEVRIDLVTSSADAA
jgi:putative redox protein